MSRKDCVQNKKTLAEQLLAKREAITAKRHALHKESETLFKEWQKIDKEYENELAKSLVITPKVIIHGYPGFLIGVGFSGEILTKVNKFFENYHYVRHNGCYNLETLTNVLQIKLPKNMELREINKAVQEVESFLPVLPHVKLKNDIEEDVKIINIFEYTLSESATYELAIGKKHCYIVSMSFHCWNPTKKFDTLYECLKHISGNHYYEQSANY